MPRLLNCPSLVYLAFALLSLGCSKKNLNATPAAAINTSGNTVTKEFVKEVGYRPVISGQIERETTIDKALSCVQWVKLTSGNDTAEAIEFHHTACPNDGTALSDDSLSFRTWLGDATEVSGGRTQKLFQFKDEQAIDVGQVMNDSGGARLEELCQFTNQTTAVPFATTCQVTESSHSWGSLDWVNPAPQISNQEQGPATSEGDTSEELARR